MYKKLEGLLGVPKVFKHIKDDDFEVIVMELLGPSLENMFEKQKEKYKKPFSPKTVLMLADEIVIHLSDKAI